MVPEEPKISSSKVLAISQLRSLLSISIIGCSTIASSEYPLLIPLLFGSLIGAKEYHEQILAFRFVYLKSIFDSVLDEQ